MRRCRKYHRRCRGEIRSKEVVVIVEAIEEVFTAGDPVWRKHPFEAAADRPARVGILPIIAELTTKHRPIHVARHTNKVFLRKESSQPRKICRKSSNAYTRRRRKGSPTAPPRRRTNLSSSSLGPSLSSGNLQNAFADRMAALDGCQRACGRWRGPRRVPARRSHRHVFHPGY